MKPQTCFAIAVFLGSASVTLAHPGPRIWVSIDGGKVTTYAGPYPPGDPSNYRPATVFSQALVNEGDNVWATDFPGFQKVPGGIIPNGKTFNYNIVGPLLWFNPGDAANCPHFETVANRFANSPPIPQMAVTNELFVTKYTSAGFVAGDAAFQYIGGAGDHNHLTYTLLGDGINAGGGPNGIYALPLELTASGAAASDTFYLLLGKFASANDIANAMDVMEHPRIAPDLDCDGDVDLDDFELFEECLAGPDETFPLEPGIEHCTRADFDDDNHVGMEDFGVFQRCFLGSDTSPDPECMHGH